MEENLRLKLTVVRVDIKCLRLLFTVFVFDDLSLSSYNAHKNEAISDFFFLEGTGIILFLLCPAVFLSH